MENQENQDKESSQIPLFRKEVLQEKKGNYFGKTLITTPISFSIWSFGIFLISIAICLYLYFGEYSKRQTVQGVIVPDKGLITVHAKNHGIVSKIFVQQGEEVKQGQLIYLVSTEQETLAGQGFSAQQIALLEKQIEVQKNKIAMYEKKASAYEELLKQHFISELEYQKRQEDYLTVKLTLHGFEKELSQAKGGADYAIRAPCAGTISVLLAIVGDHVTAETPLVSLVPRASQLEGILYVPTSKAGFVKQGQKVLLKYYAYPFQRFGLYEAVIVRVDKSIINPQETRANPLPVKMEEVFYRVTAKLRQQTVNVYGKPYPLTAGMLFEAVILGERRRIWQWIMDPVYSLKGTL